MRRDGERRGWVALGRRGGAAAVVATASLLLSHHPVATSAQLRPGALALPAASTRHAASGTRDAPSAAPPVRTAQAVAQQAVTPRVEPASRAGQAPRTEQAPRGEPARPPEPPQRTEAAQQAEAAQQTEPVRRRVDPHDEPVAAVADRRFIAETPEGRGVERYFGSGSLDGSPAVTRAFVNIHGLLRNAVDYEQIGEEAVSAEAGTGDVDAAATALMITPQFLAQVDVTGHGLPRETLRYEVRTWLDGYPAVAPAPISAFAVLDAMLARLADKTRFPRLREIVVVGHSAGGQLVQRYAVVGRAPDALASSGTAIRFVVANPSSYLYFDALRPIAAHDGARVGAALGGADEIGFARFDAAGCPRFDRWKYGLAGAPPYVAGAGAARELERRFVSRRVTYMLGMADTDPNHPVLDRSCAGEAEGPDRLARGLAYARYLSLRHPSGTSQDVVEVPGVDHDARGMFTSACGVSVLFDRGRGGCYAARRI